MPINWQPGSRTIVREQARARRREKSKRGQTRSASMHEHTCEHTVVDPICKNVRTEFLSPIFTERFFQLPTDRKKPLAYRQLESRKKSGKEGRKRKAEKKKPVDESTGF
jgi:hypothetical protein